MIAKLKGFVDHKGDDFLIIDTGPIGYQVFVSQTIKSQAEGEITLYTITLVRNEQSVLVGFLSLEERHMFELLLNVQGVGMKMALNLMSIMNANEIASAILNNEKKILQNAEGVGNKLAERIILELKNKIPFAVLHSEKSVFNQDVIEILLSLGYSRNEAIADLKDITSTKPEIVKTEEIVKLILQKRALR